METCKTVFNNRINILNGYNSFEEYYNFLKTHDPNDTFCDYCYNNESKTYSYGDFLKKVEVLSTFFSNELSMFSEKSWVGIKLNNHPYYLAILFALLQNNFNVLLLDNNGSDDYLEYVIKNAKLVAIVADSHFKFDSIKVVSFQEAISENTTLNKIIKSKEFSNKIALCTSGTTGYFNIVVYTGKQIMYQLKSILAVLEGAPIKDMYICNDTKSLVFPPLHHIYGIIMLLVYSFVGVTNVMCNKATLNNFINAIYSKNIEWVATVPLMLEALIKFMKGNTHNKELSDLKVILGENLKLCICGGAHTSPKIIKLFNESKIIFSECYGMTEAGMVSINIEQDNKERQNGSVGRVSKATCEVKVLAPDGNITDKGIGELILRGNGLYVSTLKDGFEIFRNAAEPDSFIKTGDLVKIRNDNIYFLDRIKDVIINSSGENICPGELEKFFNFLLNDKIQFTVLGINEFPVIVISLDKSDLNEKYIEIITQKIVKSNEDLPLNKRIVAIYFSTKPFPVTSAMKTRKFQLKKQIEQNSFDYIKVELIHKHKENVLLEDIKIDLKNFLSVYLNIDINCIEDESLIIEELGVDSFTIADLFSYIQEKYNIDLEMDFIMKSHLSINDIAKVIQENCD